MHEGAGHEPEILDDAACEDQPLARIILIDEHTGVADS